MAIFGYSGQSGSYLGSLGSRKQTTTKTDYAEKALKTRLDKLPWTLYNFGAKGPNFWTW